MITPTTQETFPGCPTYGFTAQPDLLVRKIMRQGGYVKRDRKWNQFLRRYEGASTADKPQADIEAIMDFYHAIGADSTVFRFKDWTDYKSCHLDATPSALDQPLQLISGATYQLMKRYAAPLAAQHLRYIRRPKGDAILIANNSGVVQSSANWTINENTGVLTAGGGFSGTPTTWGGEFYVPVTFDGAVRATITNHEIQSLQCTLLEEREG